MAKQSNDITNYKIAQKLIERLRDLTRLDGVSGGEKPVRDYLTELVKNHVDSYWVDANGNLITYKKGTEGGPRVMLAAHMDEVGLMVTGINSDGLLKFHTVGGIEARVLVGKRVRIGEKRIPGVIGYKPIHLQTPGDRKGTVNKKSLTIDIGAKDKEQAEQCVEIGDLAAFDYDPVDFGDHKLMAKALDDRAGCSVLAELLKNSYPFDLYGCFTVQEEIGLKGAKTASYAVNPDIAIVLEGTTCFDVTGTSEHMMSTWLDKGPALTIMDRSVINDRELLRFVTDLADAVRIPWQYKKTISGGTDAGRIQVSREGVKVVTMAVPCRYIHTPTSIMDTRDFIHMLRLAEETLKHLPQWYTQAGITVKAQV
jgi:putative aminopeptidase FrvX